MPGTPELDDNAQVTTIFDLPFPDEFDYAAEFTRCNLKVEVLSPSVMRVTGREADIQNFESNYGMDRRYGC